MAQDTALLPNNFLRVKNEGVAVPGSDTVLLEIVTHDVNRLALQIKNGGASALTVFTLQIKTHPDSDWLSIKTTGWTTPDALLLLNSGNLLTLASGATGFALLDVSGFWAVRIIAQSASAATVNAYALGHKE